MGTYTSLFEAPSCVLMLNSVCVVVVVVVCLPFDSRHDRDVRVLFAYASEDRFMIAVTVDPYTYGTDSTKSSSSFSQSHSHSHSSSSLRMSATGEGPEPVGSRNAAIRYGLGNILENAVDFAEGQVDVSATWDARVLSISFRDDGPGFAPEVLSKIGDPYVSVRSTRTGRNSTGGGLGLGFFIAKTLLERTGAKLFVENRAPPEHGAHIRVAWPRSAIESIDDMDGVENSGHKG